MFHVTTYIRGGADILHQVNTIGTQRFVDVLQYNIGSGLIVNCIKCGDQIVAIALIKCGGILHLKLDIIQLPQLGFRVGIGDGFSRKIIACESAIRKGDRQFIECSPAAAADIYSNPKSLSIL